MFTVCYLLVIISCLSAVSGTLNILRPDQVSAVYSEMQYTIAEIVKAEGIPIKAGFEYVIGKEFFQDAAILLEVAEYDSKALKNCPGFLAFGSLGGNFGGVLEALCDMADEGYPVDKILVIYALDYWTAGDERSDDDTKFYKGSMQLLTHLKDAGAQVYEVTTSKDPQPASAETGVCDLKDVEKKIMDLYNSTPGLVYGDGWMGTGAVELNNPDDISRMAVSTTGLDVVITSVKKVIALNSAPGSLKVVGICNDINSGIQATTGSVIADQCVPCKYLFSMSVSKPFVNTTEVKDLMKDVTVLVMFLNPKATISPNFYDTALADTNKFGLNDTEIAALKIYPERQQNGKPFAVHKANTHELLA